MPAYAFNNQLGTPSGPAAFLVLSLFKADKTVGSDRVSGDKSSLWEGRHSSLWKDSIGCRNAEFDLAGNVLVIQKSGTSIGKLANKGSYPEARTMSAIHFIVCYTAVFSVVTQRSSPLTAAENRTTFLSCD